MKIGIISDTHNNVEITRRAIAVFIDRGVQLVIHSGDISSAKMLELFKGLNCRFVLGNVDIDAELINRKALDLGFGRVELTCDFHAGEKRIFVIHGNDVPVFRKAVASGVYDYIIKGHTHCFENYVSNKARVLNPGSCYGGNEHSVLILDTEADSIERVRIK